MRRKCRRLLLVGLGTLILSCNPSEFGGKGKDEREDATSPEKAPTNPKSNKPDSEKLLAQSRPDTDAAIDKPVMVSGFKLTCAVDQEKPIVDDYPYYCRIEDSNRMKVSLAGFRVDYYLAEIATKKKIDKPMTALADDDYWHVQFTLNQQEARSGQLAVKMTGLRDGLVREKISTKLWPVSFFTRYGETQNYHLGNDEMRVSSCKALLKQNPLNGTKLEVPLQVLEATATFSIVISPLCGVDYRDKNFLQVVRDGVVINSKALPILGKQAILNADGIEPGNYTIRIEALERNTADYDDFVVGDIFLFSSSPLKSGTLESFAPDAS